VRRSIRCLLVGVLVFSLSVDTARACWYLRHARPYAVAVCPPAPACGGWVVVADVAVAGGCDPCCGPAGWQTGHVVVEEIACGTPMACCGETPAVAAIANHVEQPTTSVAQGTATAPAAEPIAPPSAVDTVVRQEPTLVLPTDAASRPVAAAQSTPVAPPAPALPELQPVEPASATEPVAPAEEANPVPVAPETPAATPEPEAPAQQAPEKPEKMEQEPAATTTPAATPDVTLPDERLPPATEPAVPAEPSTPEPSVAPEPTEPEMKEEAPVAETEPAPAVEEPVEENLFESDGATTPAATQPAAEPAAPVEPSDEPVSEPAAASAEPVADETAASEEEMEEEPGAAPSESPTEPAEESATPEAGGEEPAADEGVPFSSREPVRRWIDSSGRYAVVGVLRAVGDRDAEIVRDDGRTVRVLLERLSEHDRDYAAEAKPRLLAGPRATPRPTDTAGL